VPYASRQENMLDLINELSQLVLIYHMCIFTSFTQSIELKYAAGWSMSAITALNLIVNMTFMVYA